MMLAKATSTLAPSWHNIPSYPLISNQNHATFQNSTYETNDNLNFNKYDFSDFNDPWDNYQPQLDPFLRDSHQMAQEIEDSNRFQRLESVTIDNVFYDHHLKNSEEYNRPQESCQENYQETHYQENIHEENHQQNYQQNHQQNYQQNHHQNHQQNYQENHQQNYQQNNYQENNYQSRENYNSSHQQSSADHHSSQELLSQEELCCGHQESQTQVENRISSEFHQECNFNSQLASSSNDECIVESQKNTSREIFETGEKFILNDNLQIDEQTNTHTIIPHPLNIRIIPKKVASQSELSKLGEHLESKDVSKRLSLFFLNESKFTE